MKRFKHAVPAVIYGLLCLLGAAMTMDWLFRTDWVFCALTRNLCVSDLGTTGFVLQALYGTVGFLLMVAFAFMLHRLNRLGGTRVVINHDDRLILHRSIAEIRQLCREERFGHALMLVESLRQKYPDNQQLNELEARLHRALDQTEGR